ncbi:enhanced intracellular survival protein Eis [Peribacillus sp. SCS-155]|uniref:GNAT family N-acetyltransferase n=1 Tax=Peribacillus sedimenti TaxID=3115297 RepID=UPI003906CD91
MSSVIPLTEEYFRSAIKLSEYAFQYSVPEEKIEERLEHLRQNHKLFGVVQNGELAAKLHLIPLESFFGAKKIKMGGIAGVATFPEYRRKGYVKDLLTYTLEYMNDNGYLVSMLHPFSVPFYRKYGWELYTNKLIATLKKRDLIQMKPVNGYIKRFRKEQQSNEMEAVYKHYAAQFNGMLNRTSEWWKRSVYGDQFAALYFSSEGTPTGYLLYEIKDNKLVIEEFAALDPEARHGLWNYICQHDSMAEEVTITMHENEPLLFMLMEPRVKAEVKPYFMARIVNIEKFLQEYDFQRIHLTKELVLNITDSYAEWNNRSFVIGAGGVEVSFHEKHRDIDLDIGALTTILFGYKRPCELAAAGLITGEKEKIQLFEDIVPLRKPFMYDFF